MKSEPYDRYKLMILKNDEFIADATVVIDHAAMIQVTHDAAQKNLHHILDQLFFMVNQQEAKKEWSIREQRSSGSGL